jgi:FAD/FMN-containing dehydrogenase
VRQLFTWSCGLLLLVGCAIPARSQRREPPVTVEELPVVPTATLRDHSGLVQFKPILTVRPTSPDDLVKIMRFAAQQKRHVKAVGSLHSFSGVQAADDIAVLPQGLAFLLSSAQMSDGTLKAGVDPVARRLVRAGSGIRLRDLNTKLWELGLGLPNMGGWDEQTVGGVMNTATHGSGLAYGPFPDIVKSFDMVLPGGRHVRIEPRDGITDPVAFKAVFPRMDLLQDDDTFQSAVVSLGTMGICASYVLAVRERFYLDEQRTITTWEALKRELLKDGGIYRAHTTEANLPVPGKRFPAEHVEIALNPYQVRGTYAALVTTRKDCPAPTHPEFKPGCRSWRYRIRHPEFTRPWLSESLLDIDIVPNIFGSATRAILENFPSRAPQILESSIRTAQDDAYIERSFSVFINGATETIRAFSAEIAVPIGADDAYIRATDALLARAREYREKRWVQTGPISLRFVKKGAAVLIPQQEDVCMFDIIFLAGSRCAKEMARGYEELLYPFGGRPHFGKLNFMNPGRTQALYGNRLATFNRIRKSLDPDGIMRNTRTDQMIGVP